MTKIFLVSFPLLVHSSFYVLTSRTRTTYLIVRSSQAFGSWL